MITSLSSRTNRFVGLMRRAGGDRGVLLARHRSSAVATTLRWLSASAVFLGTLFLAAEAPTAERLIDQQPFDQLTLKEGGKVFRIVPLELEKREPLREEDRGEWLLVRLLDRPGQQYQIRWRDIDSLRLFEELVLAEAARLVDSTDFDQAHAFYRFVQRRAPEFPGLLTARLTCLYREAEYCLGQSHYDYALALLDELYRQQRRYPGLKKITGRVVDRLVENYFSKGHHVAARELLDDLSTKYVGHEVVLARRQQLMELADAEYQKALKAAGLGDLREAQELIRVALRIWPDLQPARQMEAELHEEYPVVRIGVREKWIPDRRALPVSWSSLRCRQLVEQLLFEPTSFDEQGGHYESRVCAHKIEGRRTVITVDPHVTWPRSGRPVSGWDVATELLVGGESLTSFETLPLRHSVASWSMIDDTSLAILWRKNEPWWQARLQLPVSPWESLRRESGELERLGPYRRVAADGDQVRFTLQDAYYDVGVHPPREVIETTYRDAISALRALREHEIHVYDRIVPWHLTTARRYDELQVIKYAAPSVHMLLPNPSSPLMVSGLVRKAVAAALDRDYIVSEVLGGALSDGETVAGQVLSGPFPLGYAYDESIGVRARDPRLAAALLNSRLDALPPTMKDRQVTLVYPPSDVARRAAREIQAQLQLDGLGLEVTLVESTATDVRTGPRQPWDLWYVEWYAMEPVIDAQLLLGPLSVVASQDPLLQLLVRRLDHAETREDACKALHEIHRYVHDALTVIPLWQLDEYAVIRQSLNGVGERPVTLYQNIHQWEVTLER